MKRFASRAVLAAATAAACGAGLLTGPAAQAQVIAAAGNTPVLAAWDANNQSLDFYQRNDATMLWGKPEQVARPGTTTSEPSVAQLFPGLSQLGNATGIAVQGENDSLDFYSQRDGGATWGGSQVGGPGTTFGPPALAEAGHDVVIAAPGPGGVIDFYSEPFGYYYPVGHGPTWSQQQVSGFDSGSPAKGYGYPSITQAGNYTVIAAPGPNASLYLFWEQIGSTTWYSALVAGAKSTYSGTAIAQIGNSVVIAAGNVDNMYTYTLPVGSLSSPTIGSSSWHQDLVYYNSEGVDEPSIAQVGNSAVVLDNVFSKSATGEVTSTMTTFWQPIGSGTSWTKQPVAHGGIVEGSIEQVGQSVVIGTDYLDDGTGLFWWESASGAGPWNPETVN